MRKKIGLSFNLCKITLTFALKKPLTIAFEVISHAASYVVPVTNTLS